MFNVCGIFSQVSFKALDPSEGEHSGSDVDAVTLVRKLDLGMQKNSTYVEGAAGTDTIQYFFEASETGTHVVTLGCDPLRHQPSIYGEYASHNIQHHTNDCYVYLPTAQVTKIISNVCCTGVQPWNYNHSEHYRHRCRSSGGDRLSRGYACSRGDDDMPSIGTFHRYDQ